MPYLKDRWCQFDGSMVVCLWVSAILQVRIHSVSTIFDVINALGQNVQPLHTQSSPYDDGRPQVLFIHEHAEAVVTSMRSLLVWEH